MALSRAPPNNPQAMQNHMSNPHGVTPSLRMDPWAHQQFSGNHGQAAMFTNSPSYQGPSYMSLPPQYRG